MSLSTSGRTWEEASSPAAVGLARRFESACRDSIGPRPDPDEFLPDDPLERPGARLALLRADIAIRWESGERVCAEWYREHYSDLDDETFVAIVYEEFCLREDARESPDPDEYLARFPEVAPRLRRVLDIHGLVGSGQTTAAHIANPPSVPFPEAGQTIAGFQLVEELGRGAFARVFLAHERQLADRLVALKVARTGTREPQTLARLQHTHIVPVHSYRLDPATGLHLLCMPYFGRVTLSRLLADKDVQIARTGDELLDALGRLDGGEEVPSVCAPARSALAGRSYAQAIAWWGARMAEALAHAHDRGVLHRDVKPSNVLVTGDGMPMLLDFNLSREVVGDEPDVANALGGTLDYMAPEQLTELAEGIPGRVDARSDLYSLGVLLYEALAGERPFPPPHGALSAGEVLVRAAEARRDEAPRLRDTHPEVPAPLDAVVRRCLDPDPEKRYAHAADLAADLQAVAEDAPLRFAREPLPSRGMRWLRRNRRALAMATPVVLALAVLGTTLGQAQRERDRVRAEVQKEIDEGKLEARAGEFKLAKLHYDAAARLASRWPTLEREYKTARRASRLADETGKTREAAQRLLDAAEPLRFYLAGFGGDLEGASTELRRVLQPFFVLETHDWTERGEMTLLDGRTRGRVVSVVNQLLFLWAIALERSGNPEARQAALFVCDRGLGFAAPSEPWQALRERLAESPDQPRRLGRDPADRGAPSGPALPPMSRAALGLDPAYQDETNTPNGPDARDAGVPSSEDSAVGCFQWGLLRAREGRTTAAIAWLNRAVGLEPGNYWYEYLLAYLHHKHGQDARLQADERAEAFTAARSHYEIAVALSDRSPWVRVGLARLYESLGAWKRAEDQFERAAVEYRGLPSSARDSVFESQVRLQLGVVHQSLGAMAQARADYEAVIASGASADYVRAARLNRAKLDADSGDLARALAEYDALITEAPNDVVARLGRAILALQHNAPERAEADLDALLTRENAPKAEVLGYRALARLARGASAEAASDAIEASRLDPSPAHRRLRTRALLAARRLDGLRLDRPEDLVRLPAGGPALWADLGAAADALAADASSTGATALRARLNRAVLLSAQGDSSAAREATRAVALAPLSSRVYLVRARVLRRVGDRVSALADIDQALSLAPDAPDVWELRGLLRSESGDPRAALADLEEAARRGAGGTLFGPRAAALAALGQHEAAVRDWTRALSHDPEDPHAYLGRARAFIHLQHWDQALADLEQAAGWAGDDPSLSLQIALTYARCLPERPQQLPRALALTRRAWAAARSS